jgi:hypothetical protein
MNQPSLPCPSNRSNLKMCRPFFALNPVILSPFPSLRLCGFRGKKIFFDLCKKHRHSQRAKSPVFIERNPAFFTKIHEKNKSCQAYHALEIAGVIMLQWRSIFEMKIVFWVAGRPRRLILGKNPGFDRRCFTYIQGVESWRKPIESKSNQIRPNQTCEKN